MTAPIQVIIPVHSIERPIRRAVESVLRSEIAEALVVAHNVSAADLDLPISGQVRVVTHIGDEGKPGAPRNFGLGNLSAQWFSFLDSDDWFAHGALEAMYARARKDDAEAVVSPLHKEGKRNASALPTTRTRHLRAFRDGLFYRSAPFGLFQSSLLSRVDLRFDSSARTGEDLRFSAAAWTGAKNISHYWTDPAYWLGSSANDRITGTRLPIKIEGQVWSGLWDLDFVRRWDKRTRQAFGVKIARTHLIGALHARQSFALWGDGDVRWFAECVSRVRLEAPAINRALVPHHVRALEAIERGDLEAAVFHLNSEQGYSVRNIFGLADRNSERRMRQAKRMLELKTDIQRRLMRGRSGR